ncbi:dTDP-4-dehydrorhamnose 3,5-epimerase [Fodinibius salsisoli]|uniref:dTDP-4-dehydrorhamnose 3,5-epimerase n=1 Tax=Fodinibius salsisoli TaxID=2820877 RepID=A0ABT3PLC6_9BACT|nr:dTDP-4-dehydrorhamnose 3,5-epimerase [Fodinibius salsisoli]MCW9706755.1 dTDP-4-dehydrorhamnose 3,5-epimerase [Fodinibius salsisoli]
MIFKKTDLEDAYIIELERLGDSRGFFARAFCENEFANHGIDFSIVQANTSYSAKKHTLRGMHYQDKPYQEAKLIKCTKGAIFDVIIDMRMDSPTFKQWEGIELSEQNRKMLYVPEGFAHGFMTLEDETEVYYPVTQSYTPGAEKGIRWDDPAFNIQWPAPAEIVSEKDESWPFYENTVDKELRHQL